MAQRRQTNTLNAPNAQQTSPTHGAGQMPPPNTIFAPSPFCGLRTCRITYPHTHTLSAENTDMRLYDNSPHPQHPAPPSGDLPAATGPNMTPPPNSGSYALPLRPFPVSPRDMDAQQRMQEQQRARIAREMEHQRYVQRQQAGMNSSAAMQRVSTISPQHQPMMQRHLQQGTTHPHQGARDLTSVQGESAPQRQLHSIVPIQDGSSPRANSSPGHHTAHQNVPASLHGSSLPYSLGATVGMSHPVVSTTHANVFPRQHPVLHTNMSPHGRRSDTPVPAEQPSKRQRVEGASAPSCTCPACQRAAHPTKSTPAPNTPSLHPQPQRLRPPQLRPNEATTTQLTPPPYPQQPPKPEQTEEEFYAEATHLLQTWNEQHPWPTNFSTPQTSSQEEELQHGPLTNEQNSKAHLAFVKDQMKTFGSSVGANPDFYVAAPEKFALEERRKWSAEVRRAEELDLGGPAVYVPACLVMESAKGFDPQG